MLFYGLSKVVGSSTWPLAAGKGRGWKRRGINVQSWRGVHPLHYLRSHATTHGQGWHPNGWGEGGGHVRLSSSASSSPCCLAIIEHHHPPISMLAMWVFAWSTAMRVCFSSPLKLQCLSNLAGTDDNNCWLISCGKGEREREREIRFSFSTNLYLEDHLFML